MNIDFSDFSGKSRLTANLLTIEPLRVGWSMVPDESLSSSPIIVDNKGRPYIPATSIKGAFKSALERVYNTFSSDKSPIGRIFGTPENKGICIFYDAMLDSSIKWDAIEGKIHCNDPTGKKRLIPLESVSKGLVFNLVIDIQNGTEEDAGNILIALQELNNKRAGIGGWKSRGYGFVRFQKVAIKHITLDTEKPLIGKDAISSATKLLQNKVNESKMKEGFEIFSNADNDSCSGTVTCQFEAELLTDFKVKGEEEETVLSCDEPYIPGSVIKGFLKNKSRNEFNDFLDDSKNKRSNMIVGGAFFEGDNNKEFIEMGETDNICAIKQGARLACTIVFDNMEEKHILEVVELLKKGEKITASGRRIGNKPPANINKVKFTLKKAIKFNIKSEGFNMDITDKIKRQ